MDTEKVCLELLLRRINYTDIEFKEKEKDISYCRISEKKFLKISKTVQERYSGDELLQMYHWLNQKLMKTDIEGNSHGIFSFISDIANQFLEVKDGKFVCKEYAGGEESLRSLQLLRWREMSVILGNEIFMAALLASENEPTINLISLLCTPFPTYSDAYKKKTSMLKMAENHFHLKGSIPVFTLNWVCMMNNIGDINRTFFQHFNRSLETELLYDEEWTKHFNFAEMCKQAAFYRLYLYHILNNNKSFQESSIYRTMELEEDELNELQDQINICRGYHEKLECIDYAVGSSWENEMARNEGYAIAGERNFLYCCFKAVFKDVFTYCQKNIFYRYLVISLRVRAELVQVNGKRGFSNFAEYQERKEDFIHGYPRYQKQLMNLAVKSPCKLQSLSSIELRITPKDHLETLKRIAHYDKSMEGSRLDYFYVLHLPKKENTAFVELKPRNYEIRDYLDHQIEEECALLEMEYYDYDYLGKIPRVRGYDTCSSEIDCRPEVFGQFYRQLQEYNKRCGIRQVHFTYHVGEDFLDIFSGLRAIDEVLKFCQLPRHSRIGHGMALGIDAKDYYSLKKNSSVMEKQEILDNVAWILGFCSEHGIVIDKLVEVELLEHFSLYLEEVYGQIGETDDQEKLPNERDGRILGTKLEQMAHQESAVTDMEDSPIFMNYYYAMSLRGDRPYNYLKIESCDVADSMKACCYRKGDKLDKIRIEEICRKFYRDYHFDPDVRKKGGRAEVWRVNEKYYELVTRIQEELRFILTEREIAVECNPSSNYSIGAFSRYDEHPMLRMYGKNLSSFPCSRMNVSINTDDQGVFNTSLETEYAVMYTALSKSRDEQGQPKYSTEVIKQWIKDISEFGRQQVFHFPDTI